jgi:hypothetical protein
MEKSRSSGKSRALCNSKATHMLAAHENAFLSAARDPAIVQLLPKMAQLALHARNAKKMIFESCSHLFSLFRNENNSEPKIKAA